MGVGIDWGPLFIFQSQRQHKLAEKYPEWFHGLESPRSSGSLEEKTTGSLF